MVIQNKDFWEKDNVIATQDIVKRMADFEIFMLEQANKRFHNFGTIQNIKIFGCGTGREIFGIADFFKPKKIVASDISANMISKCQDFKNIIKNKQPIGFLGHISHHAVKNSNQIKRLLDLINLCSIGNNCCRNLIQLPRF